MVRSSSLVLHTLAITIVIASVYSFIIDRECKGMLCRGDFPAFYSAATLAANNQNIYNKDLQKELQNNFWPSLEGQYLFFSYPPYVASLIRPIATLNPLQAKLLSLLFSLSAYLIALFIISKNSEQSFLQILSFSICISPNLVGLLSGQNFAFSFLILTIIILALKRQQYLIAGIANGLWIFKPHFALIAFVGIVFCRYWKTAITAASIFLLFYLQSAFMYNWDWPKPWFESIKFFYKEDLNHNGFQMISILSVFELHNLNSLGFLILFAILVLFLLQCFKFKFEAFKKLAPAIILICSPHTMPYELGLLLIPLFFSKTKLITTNILVGIFLISSLYILRSYFSFSPLFIFPLVAFVLNYRQVQSEN